MSIMRSKTLTHAKTHLYDDLFQRRYVYEVLDTVFVTWMSVKMGDSSLLVFVISLFIFSVFFKMKYMLSILILARFIIFTILYGSSLCHMYITLSILYVEAVLAGMTPLITVLFVLFVVLSETERFTFPCTIPEEKLLQLNKLTRNYVLIYMSLKLVTAKHDSQVKENEISTTVVLLQETEDSELSFLSRVSHFTKSSLNGITNFLDFLRRGKKLSGRNIESFLELVHISCGEIEMQISDLVEFYQIKKGQFFDQIVPVEPIDFHSLCHYVIDIQKKLGLEKSRKKLSLQFSIDVPQYIVSSRKFLLRILSNILSNAMKYTNEGFVQLSITEEEEEEEDVSDSKTTEMMVIKVLDTGIGIERELLERIYEPFVRNKKGKPSFSIGLVITNSLIDRMGGSIEVESEGVDMGTCVTVKLPLVLPREDTMFTLDNIKKEHKVVNLTAEQYRGIITDVLIVEDNIINRSVMKKQMDIIFGQDDDLYEDEHDEVEEDDYNGSSHPSRRKKKQKQVRVHVAENGLKGLKILEKIHRTNPLVISDLDMPVCDGFEFCRRLRKEIPNGEDLDVFALTGTITEERTKFCKLYGFDGVHNKPFPLEKMREIVVSVISSRKIEKKKKMKKKEEMKKKKKKEEEEEDVVHHTTNMKIEEFAEKKREKERIIEDILNLTFAIILVGLLYLCIDDEYFTAWRNALLLLASCYLQYPFTFFFKWSAETNAIVTHIRTILVWIGYMEFSYFIKVESIFLAELSIIVLVNQSVDSVFTSFILSVLTVIQILYYEIFRDEEGIYPIRASHHSVLSWTHYAALFFFVSQVVVFSNLFVKKRKIRKEKLENIIKRKENIKKEIDFTTSKISHDLATPASALVVYNDEIRNFLEQTGSISFSTSTTHRKHAPSEEGGGKETRYTYPNVMIGMEREYEYFRDMFGCSLNLELAIHNFLTCCKFKNDMMVSLVDDNVDFIAFVDELVHRCKLVLEKGVVLRVSHSEEVSIGRISMDVLKTRIVLFNLIMNSLQHSDATEISLSSSVVETEAKGTFIRITLEDNGKGIPEGNMLAFSSVGRGVEGAEEKGMEHKNFHFQERFPNTLGLGLVVSKILSLRMEKTSVEIQTEEGVGTTVNLEFPYRVSEPFLVLRNKKLEEISGLCVDDNMISLKFLKWFMEKNHIGEITTTSSEEEAIDLMNEKKFDILITDFNLSRINSIEMLEEVDEKDRPTVVVCVTGSPHEITDRRFFDAVCGKPVNFYDLRNAVKRFVVLREN